MSIVLPDCHSAFDVSVTRLEFTIKQRVDKFHRLFSKEWKYCCVAANTAVNNIDENATVVCGSVLT